jgi:hypothetical protein
MEEFKGSRSTKETNLKQSCFREEKNIAVFKEQEKG